MNQEQKTIPIAVLEKNVSRSLTQISSSVQMLVDALDSVVEENKQLKIQIETLKKAE